MLIFKYILQEGVLCGCWILQQHFYLVHRRYLLDTWSGIIISSVAGRR